MGTIRLNKVRKVFGETIVIPGADLEINEGEFIVFVGPSGCGKSTLLRLIAGLEDVTSGTLSINGKDVTDLPPAERRLAMVFQSYALYPHMSVRNNIAFPLKMAKLPREQIGNAARCERHDHADGFARIGLPLCGASGRNADCDEERQNLLATDRSA